MSFKFDKNTYYDAVSRHTAYSPEKSLKKEVKEGLQFTYGTVTHIEFSERFDRKYGDNKMTYLINKERNDVESDIRIKSIPCALWAAIKTIYHLACAIFVGGWDACKGDIDTAKAYAFYAGRNFIEVAGRIYSLYDPEHGQYLIEESQFHEKCYDLFFAEKAKKAKRSDEVSELINGDMKKSEKSKSNLNQKPELPNFDNVPDALDKNFDPLSNDPLSKKSKSSQSIGNSQLTSSVNVITKPLNFSQKPDFAEKLYNIKSGKNNKIKNEAFERLAEECLRWDELDMGLKVIKEINTPTDKKEKFIFKLVHRCIQLEDEEKALEFLDSIHSSDNGPRKNAIIFKMGKGHLADGDEKGGLELLGKIYASDYNDRKNAIILRMAQEHIAVGDEKGGLELLGKIYSSECNNGKNEIIFELGVEHLMNGDEKGGLELLGKIYASEYNDRKNEILFKLGVEHIATGDEKGGLDLIGKIYDSNFSQRKDEIYFTLAEKHFQHGQENIKEALNLLSQIRSPSSKYVSKKDVLIFEMAQSHFDLGQMDEAIKVVENVSLSVNKSKKIEFTVKIANTFVKDQLAKALQIMGNVEKAMFESQKFYLDLIQEYCPEGEGHDEAIIDIVRAYAIDSCKESWSKISIEKFMLGAIESSDLIEDMSKREAKEAFLNKFLSTDATKYCSIIRKKYEEKEKLGISEALNEIALSL
ncbi:MAG: hypothetical protein H0T62_00245 [Parachlamydiaceae bacterium]|nr:hypothetical protein [Parachlamydiaceae bacterium]